MRIALLRRVQSEKKWNELSLRDSVVQFIFVALNTPLDHSLTDI